MSLRARLRGADDAGAAARLYEEFGVLANPFPASNQTSDNPHYALDLEAEETAESHIVTFFRDGKSQVVVVEGTQGVGKTNFLNYFETEIRAVVNESEGYHVVRYLADPETSFEGTTRRLFEELGPDHLRRLAERLQEDGAPVEEARSHDMRTALRSLAGNDTSTPNLGSTLDLMMQWLLGLRLLKAHRQALGVQFRLDTVESKTAALRDMVQVSGKAGVLNGIFLLLDELEKQDGVLGPRAVVRYLSAVRAVVDALPERLFLMIAITPDALLRYSAALPALRGRLQNRITLRPLQDVDEAVRLEEFYVESARRRAVQSQQGKGGDAPILGRDKVEGRYEHLSQRAERRGDAGVRQREFLHELHVMAERVLQNADRERRVDGDRG